MRELVWMAQGRHRPQWDHTASILTLMANVNRDGSKKRSPYQIADFHPFRKERSAPGIRFCRANKELLTLAVKALNKNADP